MKAKSPKSAPSWIDPDEASEITTAWVAEADLYAGDKLVSRGRPRPKTPPKY